MNDGTTQPKAPTDNGSVTLAQLLGISRFRLSCLVGNDQLERPVRWAHTTELLNPSSYLRGGELICTVGTSLTNAEACRQFVLSVQTAGASAICFGAGDVHDEVPADLLMWCQDATLPLLVAPLGVPFIEIGEYLAEHVRHARASAGDDERSSQLLSHLLSLVRARSATSELLDVAAKSLGGRLVLKEEGRPEEPSGSTLHAELHLSAQSPDGTTLTWSGREPAPTTALLRTLAYVMGVAKHDRDVGEDLQWERVGQLLSLVGDRLANPSALAGVLTSASMATSNLVFSIWPAGASRVLASSLSGQNFVVGETPLATIAVTSSHDHVRPTAERLGFICGFSTQVDLVDSARAIGEARAAFEVARRSRGCVGPEGLTTLEGLLEQQPSERLRPFDQLLAPLERSDASRRTSFVHTLEIYFNHGGSLTATAREEFLHVNTVRHRLERIHQLTGRNPFDFEDKVSLAIALWSLRRRDRGR